MMKTGMVFGANKLEILRTIIGLDMINMMDVFSCHKRASKNAFHYYSMFERTIIENDITMIADV